MIDLAATADLLRARIPDLAPHLAAALPLGNPPAEVAGDLRFLLEIVATGLELGSCGLVDRTLAWQKVRTRALGGDVAALTRLPGLVAAQLAPALDAAQRGAREQLLDHAATFVRFAPAAAPTGRGPLLQTGTAGHAFLAAAATCRSRCAPSSNRRCARSAGGGRTAACRRPTNTWSRRSCTTSSSRSRRRPRRRRPTHRSWRWCARRATSTRSANCAPRRTCGAGYATRILAAPARSDDLVTRLAPLAPAAVAITCTTALQARSVRPMIDAIRAAPALARGFVLLGGHLVLDVPQLPTQLGADGGACDGPQLATLLRGLLPRRQLARA